MRNYEQLTSAIGMGLREYYGIDDQDFQFKHDNTTVLICRTHLHHLVMIELVLEHYRENNNSIINVLNGPSALHHMIYAKTNWKPEFIRQMSLEDMLFVLTKDLSGDTLPGDDKAYLKTIIDTEDFIEVDLKGYHGWQIGIGDQYLRGNISYMRVA